MASMAEILQFKAMKDVFSKLYHSERASIIQVYGKMPYDQAYKMTAQNQGKLLFQMLYTAKDTDEIRRKIESYLRTRECQTS